MEVKVLDALMGSGKTTKLINDVSLLPNDRPVIYIAPLLSECHRFAGTQTDEEGDIVVDDDGQPVYENHHPLACKAFKHPSNKNRRGTKLESLTQAIGMGKNIVSTHSLFRMMNEDITGKIKEKGYTLIIDEVLCVWEKYTINKGNSDTADLDSTDTDKEIASLISSGIIEVDPCGVLHWQWDKFSVVEGTHYEETATLCDTKQLFMANGTVVLWEYPLWVLEAFKEVWIATYMFESSFMAEYFKLHGIKYKIERFGKKPTDYKHLVTVVEDSKLNACGEKPFSLSYSSIVYKKTYNEKLKDNLYNFFRNKTKSKVHERLWTTYSARKSSISAGRYATSWLNYNAKATNDYKEAKYVAYFVNVYANVMILAMLRSRAALFDQDKFALSEMVQFVWRSAIRDEKPIVLYVPSKRMREMFIKWINSED